MRNYGERWIILDQVDHCRYRRVTNEESNLDTGIVRAMELVLEHRQRILFDPMWTAGVRISNAGPWLDEIEHGPWTFLRHTWTRPPAPV